MIIVLRCSILAVIIFIPLSSIQHFIEPLSDCLLADICNHTWIPECAEDQETAHTRLFIDECDIYEYNCDYDVKYLIVNYSDCFGPMTCPTLPPQKQLLRQGNYLYRGDGRLIYSPTRNAGTERFTHTRRKMKTAKHFDGKRRYTPEKGRKKKKTTPCGPCMRARQALTPMPDLKPKPKPKAKPKSDLRQVRPPKLLGTTKKFTTVKTTKQVIKTATIGTVILKKVTVIKDGKKYYKVVKGYAPKTTAMTRADSDYLE